MKRHIRILKNCLSSIQARPCCWWHSEPVWQATQSFGFCMYSVSDNEEIPCTTSNSQIHIKQEVLSAKSPRPPQFSGNWPECLSSLRIIYSQNWERDSGERKRRTENSSQCLQSSSAKQKADSLQKSRHDNSAYLHCNMIASDRPQVDTREQKPYSS